MYSQSHEYSVVTLLQGIKLGKEQSGYKEIKDFCL